MGRRGPKPQPAALKVMRNNLGKRPIPAEPLASGKPTATEELSGKALELWNRVVPQLVSMGVAKEIDSDSLTALCQWWQKYQDLAKRLDMCPRLQTAAMANAWRCFQNIAQRFGLSPSDRVGLIVDANDKPDAFDEFMAARQRRG